MADDTTITLENPTPQTVQSAQASREKITAETAAAALEQRYQRKNGQQPQQRQQPNKELDFAALREDRDKAIKEAKTYRATVEERAVEIEGYKKQIEEFGGTKKGLEELQAKLSQVEQERDTYKKVQSRAALEATPEYQQKYVTGRDAAVARARELAEAADISPDDLSAALDKRGKAQIKALDELLGGVSRFVSEGIYKEVQSINGLDTERAQALEQADALMKSRTEEQTAAERRESDQRSKVRAQAWQDTSAKLKGELGLDDKTVEAAHEQFKTNRDAGKAAEVYLKATHYDAVKADRDALKAELAKYVKAAPGVSAGAGKDAVTAKETRADLIGAVDWTRGTRR